MIAQNHANGTYSTGSDSLHYPSHAPLQKCTDPLTDENALDLEQKLRSTAPHAEPVADLHSKILDARPRGWNSFNFMQFLGNFGKSYVGAPSTGEWAPPPRGNPGSATENCRGSVSMKLNFEWNPPLSTWPKVKCNYKGWSWVRVKILYYIAKWSNSDADGQSVDSVKVKIVQQRIRLSKRKLLW